MIMKKSPIIWFLIILLISIIVAALAPIEKTLGSNARLVYFHGAWVWTAMLAFIAAALTGLIGVLSRRLTFHNWSLALGRTGLLFWIAFLPMSLIVMQANWNGLFLDEPRFRIPLNFAIVGLLLQIGLTIFSMPFWSSVANLAYGYRLFLGNGSGRDDPASRFACFQLRSTGHPNLLFVIIYLIIRFSPIAWLMDG